MMARKSLKMPCPIYLNGFTVLIADVIGQAAAQG